MRKIIVGSRRSKLALTQTKWVIRQLEELGLPFEFEVKEIVTKGDVILDVQLSKVGGKGLFVKEIEHAMLNKEIDMAVHSMKDMPAVLPEGLIISCTPKRVDPRDVLISNAHVKFEDLKEGAVIGTSSLRRSAQLLAVRPDLQIKWIRGNVDTRLEKLKNEGFDGIILAAAGLTRLSMTDVVTEPISEEIVVPAVGQGVLAIQSRTDDIELLEALKKFNDAYTEKTVTAERVFLGELNGGCQVPIGGYATINEQDEVVLTALVGSMDGKTILKEVITSKDPIEAGKKAAELLRSQGAEKFIQEAAKAQAPIQK